MTELAIIGGTGLRSLAGLEITRRMVKVTPYGEPSSAIVFGIYGGKEVAFLARHGAAHTIPPHEINYRANIWTLNELGVKNIIAVAAVGGITPDMDPARIAIPDQIIDYTSARANTFFQGQLDHVTHIDFSYPYSDKLRALLIHSAREVNLEVREFGTYGATQGPRLETAAEIRRLEQDGCHIVGMTGMPEAALARELEINYACCAVVANWAAGKAGNNLITMKDIELNLKLGMERVKMLLAHAIPRL